MDQIIFESTTLSHWYDQYRWQLVTDNAFINHLNRHVRSRGDEAHQFRLDLVMLELKEDQTISITREHFQSLLQRFEMPETSIESLFQGRDGRYTHSVQYSRVSPEGPPSSLCISLQTPPLEFDKENKSLPVDSFSALLRISVRTNSAACIIMARRSAVSKSLLERPATAADRIAGALQRNYDLIQSCPFQIMNILSEQFDCLNEKYWNARESAFFKLRTLMDGFCKNPTALYDDDGMAIFGVIHGMNIMRRKLIPLEYSLEFELATLRYTQAIMEEYQNMQREGNRFRFSQAVLDKFYEKNQYLETAATFRQKRREGLKEWAGLNVDILRSSNAQHDTKLTLDDSIAVKMISFITLIFLPISVVATISGSNAFAVENSSIGNGVKVWNNWWILVIITLCLTGAVLGGGVLYWMIRRYKARPFTDLKHGGHGTCPYSKIGEMET